MFGGWPLIVGRDLVGWREGSVGVSQLSLRTKTVSERPLSKPNMLPHLQSDDDGKEHIENGEKYL